MLFLHNNNLYLHARSNIMKKREIIDRKVSYELNTSIKHIKTDGKNKDYIYVQHKHEDYQLRLIVKGAGVCMVGECIVEYKKGDILFVGRNVPHCSSLYEYTSSGETPSESEVLQFHPDLFPVKIHELPDFLYISNILLKSQNGLVFRSLALSKKVGLLIDEMRLAEGIEKVNCLFRMLEILGKSKHGALISESQFDAKNTFCESYESLQKVYDYLYRNMKKEVTLEDISQYVNLNPAALCRAFKSKTRMTIFQFLNKIRIENVCKLLVYSDLSISQVAYESGFNNMAYFNRRFRESTNMSPSEYRNQVKQK